MRTAIAILAGAILAGCAATDSRDALGPTRRIDRFPDTIQSNSYSCGVAAVQAVLHFYGHWGYQDEYAKEMGTTEKDGTHPVRMVECLRKRGLDARLVEGMTVDQLKRFVDEGVPAIVDFQAWNGKPPHEYAKEWEDGHYGVVVGYDRDRLYIEDPSLLDTVGYLSIAEFEKRWHDYEEEEGKRREYVRMGIVVRGKPAPPPPYSPIE